MLNVKLLAAGAIAPRCARPGEDLGYDLFALEYEFLRPGRITKVRTGVAVEGTRTLLRPTGYGVEASSTEPLGFIIKDRSSMASKGIFTHGGVIDAGYRGEIIVLMSWLGCDIEDHYNIDKGDKIAQLVPVLPLTGQAFIVDQLTEADRGEKGFGSSGR